MNKKGVMMMRVNVWKEWIEELLSFWITCDKESKHSQLKIKKNNQKDFRREKNGRVYEVEVKKREK